MRTYEKTHPYLTFELDTKTLDYRTWLLLGEAVSKVEHIAGVPLDPDAAEKLHSLYLAKGVLATTAIEGNTLTEDEVQEHLAGRLRLPPSREYLGREISNVVEACNRIGKEVLRGDSRPIPPEEIGEYNRLVLRGLPLQEDVVPGRLRRHSVAVGRYRAVPPEDCEFLLGEFCRWLNSLELPHGLEQPYSILVAIAAHLHFVWIHPFGDGNGRTARLIEFGYLLRAGFPTPAAHLLSNFYNQTRTEYYRQLDKASKKTGRMGDFIAYAVQGLVDGLREQLQFIRDRQWDTAWRDFVFSRFRKESPTRARQRRLVLELSKVTRNGGWIPVGSIRRFSLRMLHAYANKTSKTITRDINTLVKMGLIEHRREKPTSVRAKREIILAFLPARASSGPRTQ